jgi:peptidoglycan/xylan/chitin deacetylase (PgdA/CDA1 family)
VLYLASLLVFAFLLPGVGLVCSLKAQPAAVAIFTYHRVLPPGREMDPRRLHVSTDTFKDQLDCLAQAGCETMTLRDFTQRRLAYQAPPRRAVILTFDDGMVDFYEHAYPILRKGGFRATVFVVTDWIGREGFLDWSQLEVMASNGVEIACHSASHANLTTLHGADLDREIAGSKLTLERRLGRPVHSFCYPGGRFNDEVVRCVSNAHYRAATTTVWGAVAGDTPPLLLPRMNVREWFDRISMPALLRSLSDGS